MKKYMSISQLMKEYRKCNKKGLSVSSQVKLFKIRTGRSRRTFFSTKYLIANGKKQSYTKYGEIDPQYRKCFFCRRKSYAVHHIDMDRNNNKTTNLITLCASCHQKLHGIYSKIKFRGGGQGGV